MNFREIKVTVVGRSIGYASFLNNYKIVDPSEAEIAIFTGGEDVNPSLYGAEVHPSTYYSNRDKGEVDAYEKLIQMPNIKLLVGICRGLQLGCVLNGGLLIQDVTNHAISGGHSITMKDTGKKYNIKSLHHQMVYPFNLPKDKYEILASSTERRSSWYEGDLINPLKVTEEPEIVLFHGPKEFLGIQGHPEMMDRDSDTVQMINELIYGLL